MYDPSEAPEFPKMVYLSNDPNNYVIIKSADEMPDDAKEIWTDFAEEDVKTAKDDADAAKEAAKAADKELREEIMAYLDEYDVAYKKNISTVRLEALKVELDKYLEQKEDDHGDK